VIEQAISHFRELKKFGESGMGEAYLTEDTALECFSQVSP